MAERFPSDVARTLAGPWLQITVTVGGMFAAVAMFSALLASNARIPCVAEDGHFPGWIAKRSARRRFRSPRSSARPRSTRCSASAASATCSSSTSSSPTSQFLFEVAAFIALRIREPELARPYRIPGGVFSVVLITLSLTGVCAWAAWQQYLQNGTQTVTNCLFAVGAPSCCPCRWPGIAATKPAKAAEATAIDG